MATTHWIDRDVALSSLNRPDPLQRLQTLIPWEQFRRILENHLYPPRVTSVGRKPFDVIMMFKVLVLQTLYNLSDGQTEYQIRDRLTFMRFLGFPPDQPVPDEKTIWVFRERIKSVGLLEELFNQFESYLQDKGYSARDGILVDASLIEVPRQRNQRWENRCIKKSVVPQPWLEHPAKYRQKDIDARWTRKHGQNYYGYKNHVSVDGRHRFIRRFQVTPASTNDGQLLPELLDSRCPKYERQIYADNAYRTIENILHCIDHGFSDRFMHRTHCNVVIQEENHRWNRIRCRIEHVFGFMANSMGGKLVRTIGLARAKMKIGLMNLVYNFCRLDQLKRLGRVYLY